ncbi:MAG: phosphoglycolate phosphatase [Thermodesulfobacteriota bacterium]
MPRVIKKDLIIFDLDGTLVDSSGDIAHAANKTLREMGFPSMTVSEIKANVGWGVRSLLEKVMPNEPVERIDEARRIFLNYYSENLVDETRFYPGVEDTVRHFHASGKRLAIATNKQLALTERILDELEFKSYFSMLVGGDSVLNKKPHPEPLLFIMKSLGAESEETVFVGDSAIDCESGASAGVFTIGAAYGFRGKEELEKAGCGMIIESFPELEGIII